MISLYTNGYNKTRRSDFISMKTPRKTEQEWMKLLADCKARPKGTRISDWCDQRGVNLGTYKYWRKKLSQKRKGQSAEPEIHFVPLKVPVQAAEPIQHHAEISIKYKDFEIIVTERSSQELLTRLLTTVRTSC